MAEVITSEMQQLRLMIAQTVAKREALKTEMDSWYQRFPNKRFEQLKDLIMTDSTLSSLDTQYKKLWDFHNHRCAH